MLPGTKTSMEFLGGRQSAPGTALDEYYSTAVAVRGTLYKKKVFLLISKDSHVVM